MATGYGDDNGREESAGRRLDDQGTVECFRDWKELKDATNRMLMINFLLGSIIQHGHRTNLEVGSNISAILT
jgi:hypothetical protein